MHCDTSRRGVLDNSGVFQRVTPGDRENEIVVTTNATFFESLLFLNKDLCLQIGVQMLRNVEPGTDASGGISQNVVYDRENRGTDARLLLHVVVGRRRLTEGETCSQQ